MEGSIYLPRIAEYLQKQPDVVDLINHALIEVLHLFSRGEDLLKDIVIDKLSDCEDSPNSQESPSLLSPIVVPPSFELPTIPLPIGTKLTQPKSLLYLLDCYLRIATEEKNHPKVHIYL